MTDRRAPSDADLLAAHVAGDPDAFGMLFARHRDRLWAVALRTMGNREDAADGLQDGMVAAYRRAGTFRGDAAVTTWLHRVVVNACLDRLRAAKVRRTEALPDDLDERGDRGSLRVRDRETDDPADHAVAERAATPGPRRAARRCPTSSAPRWCWSTWRATRSPRRPQILDCAVGTVKSRCSRGRARLAELLAPLLDADQGDRGHAGARNPRAAAARRTHGRPARTTAGAEP